MSRGNHSLWQEVWRTASSILLLALLVLPLRAEESAGKILRENWVIVLLQGKRCGFGSTIVRERETPAGKQYVTDANQEFKLLRQGHEIHMITRSCVVENDKGVVINFQMESRGAGSNQTMRGYRVGEEMAVFSGEQTKRYPLPSTVLGPEAFDRFSRQVKMEPGATFSAQTFLADFPQAGVTLSGAIIGKEAREFRGQMRDLWKLRSTMSLMPGLVMTAYLDDKGDTELVVMPFPGIGDMQLVSTTRADAMKELENIEVFTNTLVAPKQPLTNVRSLSSATLRLTVTDTTQPLTLWSGAEQTVLESKPGQSTVKIIVPQIDEKSITWQLPRAADKELASYLGSTFYLEKTPKIEALAKQAVGDEKNPVRATHAIEKFVRSYIQQKDLSVNFASAEETAASRAGDCTEHAVLCAALGRAVGLPTRTVVGFGYLPTDYAQKQSTGTFGFHMWAEAWVGPDQWVPMDAALGSFDVGHIAIAKSPLEEVNPLADLTMPILNLLQNLQIEVLETKAK